MKFINVALVIFVIVVLLFPAWRGYVYYFGKCSDLFWYEYTPARCLK